MLVTDFSKPSGDVYCNIQILVFSLTTFSALTLLVGRQEGHLACKKTERWGARVVVCLEQDADLHTAQLMPLPLTVACFSKIQIGVCVCVCVSLTGEIVSADQSSPSRMYYNQTCLGE